MTTKPRQFVSLFSGILGLDLGFERQGWECVAANELDPAACATIKANRPNLNLYAGDMRDLSVKQILADTGTALGEIDAVIGGPPCQAFSTAGKRRSLVDERGSLVVRYLTLATGLQPRWIVMENVRGLAGAEAVFTLTPTDHSGAQADSQVMVEIRDGAYRLLP